MAIIKHEQGDVVTVSSRSLERILQRDNSRFSDTAVLLDSSGSMGAYIGSVSRWDHLLHAVNVHFAGTDAHCVVFASVAQISEIENPVWLGGSTNMNLAFRLVNEQIPGIKNVILISDGVPTCGNDNVFDAALDGGYKVDCIFIGEDDDPGADFLKKLAKRCNGKEYTVKDKPEDIKLLKDAIKGLLPERTIQL